MVPPPSPTQDPTPHAPPPGSPRVLWAGAKGPHPSCPQKHLEQLWGGLAWAPPEAEGGAGSPPYPRTPAGRAEATSSSGKPQRAQEATRQQKA